MRLDYFMAGCIGAIAPEILRLYQIRLRRKTIRFSRFYCGISIFYILLGGYVASIFPGIQGPFWAMCVGVGLVPTVNTMAKLGGLLSLRLKIDLDKIIKGINKSGGTPDLVEIPGLERGLNRPIRQGNFWDFTKML
jgi:hypothetical protein